MVVPADWKEAHFDEAFSRVNISNRKLQTSDFSDMGKLPVIDQGQTRIAGYTDCLALELIPPQDGLVIFGDHTRVVKHVRHPFVVGADGVQVLRSRDGFNAEFLALLLSVSKIPNTGYNRHFKFLRDLTFTCPSNLIEQEAIAEALSDADAAIESLDALIAKKRDVKQATMQQLLTGRTRLPGFTADWKEVRLGECLTIMHGKNQSQIIDPEGRYPILATGGVIGRTNSYLSNKPSVLIGRKGTIDRPQFMDTPFWTVDTLFYSEVKNGNFAKFLFYKFLMVDWKKYNEASGVPSLNASTIENVEMLMPALKEQEAIADALSVMDDELQALTEQVSKLRMVKEGMMQDLLTGKVRLV